MSDLIDIRGRAPNSFRISLGGLERLCPVESAGTGISIVGDDHLCSGEDEEFTAAVGALMAEKLRRFDPECVLTAETKSLVFAGELAGRLGNVTLATARKGSRPDTDERYRVQTRSITSPVTKELSIDNSTVARIAGRRTVLFDDVISTCGTMNALRELAHRAEARVVAISAVWIEGPWVFEHYFDKFAAGQVVHLGVLPLFAEGPSHEELMSRKAAVEQRLGETG